MKYILVIDEMPDICYKCPCYDHEGGICQASNSWKTDRENGCPLKPLPTEFKTYKLSPRDQEQTELFTSMALLKTYADGWNDCLKEIEK